MAREAGDVSVKDPPPPPISDDDTSPEATTAYPPDPDPSAAVPSIVAALIPNVPEVPGGVYGPGVSAVEPDDTPDDPDTSTDTAPPLSIPYLPPGLSEEQAQNIRDSGIKILDEQMGARAAAQRDLDRRDKEFEAQMASLNRSIGYEGSHLQPWNADREMAERKHNLWEEFGSPGFLVAMLASSFTAMPMVSALNGGAAAMNAINEGDIAGYDKAFEAWQQNTKLTLDRMKTEQDMFNNIEKLRTDNYARWKEELALKLDQFGDKRKKALLENGMDEDVIKSYEALEKLRGQIESNYQAQIENKALFDGVQNELKQDPKQSWFDAYAKTIEKLNRAKNAGKFSSADSYYWSRAEAITPDPAEQAELVAKWKREAKGETKATLDKEQKDKIRDTISKEHEGDPNWNEGKTELEVERRLADAKRAVAKGITSKIQEQIKSDLREALGHDLPPTMEAALDAAYAAKGVNSARIVTAVGGAINKIKEDLAAGKTEAEIKPEDRINQAVANASASAARSAATLYMQKWNAEHPNATAAEAREASLRYQRAQKAVASLGTRAGNIAASIEEISKIGQLAENASDKMKRGKITPFNNWNQVIARSTGTPGQGEFDVYTAGVLSAYANMLQRGGHTSDAARSAALALLSTAYDKKTYKERVEAMKKEAAKIKEAVEAAEDDLVKSEGREKPKSEDPYGIQ